MKSSKFILNRDKIFDSNMLEEKKTKDIYCSLDFWEYSSGSSETRENLINT